MIYACCPHSDAVRPLQMSPLANAVAQTIPAMRQNEAAVFEFSAVPSLLQRLPPPSHIRLLANSSALQALGALQLFSHVVIFIVLTFLTRCVVPGFARPNALNDIRALPDNVWKPCRIDSFGPLPSGEW